MKLFTFYQDDESKDIYYFLIKKWDNSSGVTELRGFSFQGFWMHDHLEPDPKRWPDSDIVKGEAAPNKAELIKYIFEEGWGRY